MRRFNKDAVAYPESEAAVTRVERYNAQTVMPELMQTAAPTFTLKPTSNPEQPLATWAGQEVTVEVCVVNSSSTADRFTLSCTAWPASDLIIRYPSNSEANPANHLTLLPGEQGSIKLTLVPPADLSPGSYAPLVHLTSTNHPDLELTARIYLWLRSAQDLEGAPLVTSTRPLRSDSTVGPRWPLLLALLGGLGLLGGLSWLLGWLVFRSPAQPRIVEFYPEQSDYSVVGKEGAEVGWQIAQADQVGVIKLTGYDAKGRAAVGPITYNLSSELPDELKSRCTTTEQILNCRNVPTTARQPGEYAFELTLLPKSPLTQEAQSKTSSLVTIQGAALPAVAELVPAQVIYSEMGTPAGAAGAAVAPAVTPRGVELSWAVVNPVGLQDLLLVVRQADGSVLGGKRYRFRNPAQAETLDVPDDLKPYCQVQATLVCQNVPTGIRTVGRYTFELTPIPLGQSAGTTPQKTEVVQIQPRPIRIASFKINGREAQARYVIPVEPGQGIPGLVLSWEVEGGETAKAALLPSPGTVPLRGSMPLPINPAGETTLALQVSSGSGDPIVRSVTIVTYTPAASGSAAAQAAIRAAQAVEAAPARPAQPVPPTAPVLTAPTATDPERLSPAEGPAKFD